MKLYFSAPMLLFFAVILSANSDRDESPIGDPDLAPDYIISIDAGSTGSRVFIYEYTLREGLQIPQIRIAEDRVNDANTAWVKKVTPGLGTFITHIEDVEAYLEKLLAFAYEKLGDKVQEKPIPVLFEATGGFRKLPAENQAKLLERVQRALSLSPFRVASVDVIDGQREGIYGWLGINYLLNNLSKERRQDTMGLFEMGGHSLQITFEPDEKLVDHGIELHIGPHHYTLYSHSYSGYGEVSARKSWTSPGCEISNHEVRSSFEACRMSILEKLEAKHHIDAHGGLDGVYQPKIHGKIVGVDNVAETAKFLPLGPFSDDELVTVGKDICSMTPEILKKNFPRKSEKDIDRACFDAAYISAIMTGYGEHSHFRGLGLQDKAEVVHGIEFINDKPITWTIGSALYYLTQPEAEVEVDINSADEKTLVPSDAEL